MASNSVFRVIDHDFHHDIVKVAVDSWGDEKGINYTFMFSSTKLSNEHARISAVNVKSNISP